MKWEFLEQKSVFPFKQQLFQLWVILAGLPSLGCGEYQTFICLLTWCKGLPFWKDVPPKAVYRNTKLRNIVKKQAQFHLWLLGKYRRCKISLRNNLPICDCSVLQLYYYNYCNKDVPSVACITHILAGLAANLESNFFVCLFQGKICLSLFSFRGLFYNKDFPWCGYKQIQWSNQFEIT